MVRYKKKVNKGLIVLSQGETIGMMTLLAIIAVLLAFSVFRPVVQLTRQDRMAFHRLDSLLALQEEETDMPARASPQENANKNKVAGGSRHREERSDVATRRLTDQREVIHMSSDGSRTSKVEKAKTAVAEKPGINKMPVMVVIDINLADSTGLMDLPQIGAVMSSRIQRYRERLGGFVAMEQLYEVKGMDTARYEVIRPYITLGEHDLRKLRVNSDEFKVLLRHPYLDYDQVKVIVNHRERRGLITSWQQLHALLPDCNPLLEHYLDYQ